MIAPEALQPVIEELNREMVIFYANMIFFMPRWGNGHLSLEEFYIKTKYAGSDDIEMNMYP